MDNSIDANASHVRIRFVRRDNRLIRLYVTDDGDGIAPDHLERIFDLFTQADVTYDRAAGGLGIGLALVKRLVELHGGSVAAASPGKGQGATFTVRLPRPQPSG